MARAGCLLAAALLLAGRAEAAPTFSFEPTALNVGNLTPGGRTFVFGVVWRTDKGVKVSRHTTFLSDGDGDGQARLDLGSDTPRISVWFAVDFANGQWSTAGAGVRATQFPWQAIPHARDRLVFHCERIYIAVVRPGTGAWILQTSDGAELDGDGDNNGEIRAGLASFSAFGNSPPPPAKLAAGDIVLIIDPERLLYSARVLER